MCIILHSRRETSTAYMQYSSAVPVDDPQPFLEFIGRRIRQLRDQNRLTAAEVADRASISLRFYRDLESGRANIAVGRLARALKLGARTNDNRTIVKNLMLLDFMLNTPFMKTFEI